MHSLSEWVQRLGDHDLPVLRRTREELIKLHANDDSVTARHLAELVLRDPFMTVKLLRYSQQRLTSRQLTEVTTAEHAIMMHGVAGFFHQFRELVALEEVLAAHPEALEGVLAVASRAYHAAIAARNFAALRHDVEHEEVMVSALLHDLAEMLLWCAAPAIAVQIEQMVLRHRGLRSAAAQTATLGFPLADLQAALVRRWRLPKLLQALMDDRHAGNARVQSVHLAVSIARHAAHGWHDAGLEEDYKGVQRLLNLPPDQVQRWIRQSALQAARAWQQFGVPPAAAWFPMLPGQWGAPESQGEAQDATSRKMLLARVVEQLSAASQGRRDTSAIVAVGFYGLHAGLGLRRLSYARIGPGCEVVEPQQTLFLDAGLSASDLRFELTAKHLFAKLMERPAGVWLSAANRDKIAGLLPPTLRQKIGGGDFFAMSLHLHGAPHGLIYADAGGRALDETRYNAFKQICAYTAQALQAAPGR